MGNSWEKSGWAKNWKKSSHWNYWDNWNKTLQEWCLWGSLWWFLILLWFWKNMAVISWFWLIENLKISPQKLQVQLICNQVDIMFVRFLILSWSDKKHGKLCRLSYCSFLLNTFVVQIKHVRSSTKILYLIWFQWKPWRWWSILVSETKNLLSIF